MSFNEKASQIIDWFIQYHLDSDVLIEKIRPICKDESECSRWFLFTPLVFTRLSFPTVTFPKEYIWVHADGSEESMKFEESEVYNALKQVAKDNWDHYTEEQKTWIMFKYHQYHNISDAIRSGANAAEIEVKTVKII